MSKDEFEAQIRAAYKQTEARRAAGFASTFIIFEAGYKAGYSAASERVLETMRKDLKALKEARRVIESLSRNGQKS